MYYKLKNPQMLIVLIPDEEKHVLSDNNHAMKIFSQKNFSFSKLEKYKKTSEKKVCKFRFNRLT